MPVPQVLRQLGEKPAAIREKIAALTQEIAIKRASSAEGVRAAQAEAEAINRNMDAANRSMQAHIRATNQLARAEQQAAQDSARYEAESINSTLAKREAAARAAIAASNARVYKEREMEDAAAARAAARARGQGLTLTPAAHYRERVDSQLGIQPRLDPRARAQLQQQLEMTFAELEPVAETEGILVGAALTRGMGGGISRNTGLIQRESSHLVSIFDSGMRGQRGQMISSIGAAARDAGFGVTGLTASLGGLIAIMGTSALIHGAQSMGKWASETRAAASAAGMSIQNYSGPSGRPNLDRSEGY